MRRMYSKKQIEEISKGFIASASEGTIAESLGLDEDGNIVKGQGGGGGASKYAHFIQFTSKTMILVIAKSSEPFTATSLHDWLYNNGYIGTSNLFKTFVSNEARFENDSPNIIYQTLVGLYTREGLPGIYGEINHTTISVNDNVISASLVGQLRATLTFESDVVVSL